MFFNIYIYIWIVSLQNTDSQTRPGHEMADVGTLLQMISDLNMKMDVLQTPG